MSLAAIPRSRIIVCIIILIEIIRLTCCCADMTQYATTSKRNWMQRSATIIEVTQHPPPSFYSAYGGWLNYHQAGRQAPPFPNSAANHNVGCVYTAALVLQCTVISRWWWTYYGGTEHCCVNHHHHHHTNGGRIDHGAVQYCSTK